MILENKINFNELKEKGFYKVKNFLDLEEVTKVKKILEKNLLEKNHPKSYFSTKIIHFIYKILKFKFLDFSNHIYIFDLAKKKKLKDLSNKFFGQNSYLKFIDGYYSPISDQDVLPWHTDAAYQGEEKNRSEFVNPDHFHLKFFIYLSKVGPNNGCTSYIPYSHKIGYAIRKGIYTKKLQFEPYFTLADFRKFVLKEKNFKYLKNEINDQKIIEDFLNQTKFIDEKKESFEFDYELNAGDAIIFDEGGVHKGSKSLKNERFVLRYLYSRRND